MLLVSVASAPFAALSQTLALECEVNAFELDALETEELLELSEEPGYEPLLDRALELASQQLAEQLSLAVKPGPADEFEDDPRAELAEQAQWLSLMQIRRALDAGDRVLALQRVERLLWEILQSVGPGKDNIDEADEEERQELQEELISIRAILLGGAPPAPPPVALQAKADWRPKLSFCGTPAGMLDWWLRRLSTPMAAWHAVGQPRRALDLLIDRHWINALDLGMAPPMLFEYAEASLGPGSYARELERGLSQLRIERDLDGGRAWLPMFGRELPVPLGYQQQRPMPGDQASHAAKFSSPEDQALRRERLVAALRQILRPTAE